jgi:hypothetical protein
VAILLSSQTALMYKKFFVDKDLASFLDATLYGGRPVLCRNFAVYNTLSSVNEGVTDVNAESSE